MLVVAHPLKSSIMTGTFRSNPVRHLLTLAGFVRRSEHGHK
jgi:hypothetical protein